MPLPTPLPKHFLEETDVVNVTQSDAVDADDLPSDSVSLPLITLYNQIVKSTYKLFFVSYTPADTMRPRWYLVQVSLGDSPTEKTNGMYFCSFLQRHPSDSSKSDISSRWWPEWRELNWLSGGSCYDYGSRVLFSPRNKQDLKKYGKFSEEVDLSCDQTYLLEPFNFLPKDSSTPVYALINVPTWIQLNEICEARSILRLTVGHDSGKTAANVVLLRQNWAVMALTLWIHYHLALVRWIWENIGLDKLKS